MDLLSVLPGFATKPYAHILPPLERSKLTTVDLITLDTLEIAKRAHVPPADVRRLSARIVEALHADLGFVKDQTAPGTSGTDEPSSSINADAGWTLGPATRFQPRWNVVSTMDPAMDALLGGGIPTGYVTEVTGESGSGKTQFLLSLLLAAQLPKPHGLQKQAIYISTEHPLATGRLSQLLECHPILSTLPEEAGLRNILSINAMDMETQDHILNYQLPVAISRHNVGLVVIDSITSNYRAEHTSNSMLALSARSTELARLGQMLRDLAAKEDVAIVVANQVSDRFDMDTNARLPPSWSQNAARDPGPDSPFRKSQGDHTEMVPDELSQPDSTPSSTMPSSPCPAPEQDHFDGSYLVGNSDRNEVLSLLHQERFFTGWGDDPQYGTVSLKTPALGFFWSTQIACRIALKKETTHTAIAPWDDVHHLSTPREQMGPDPGHQSRQPDSTGFASARITHDTESETETKDANENGQMGIPPEKKTQVSVRPPLVEEPEHLTRRTMKVAFAPWTGPAVPRETDARSEEDAIEASRRGKEVAFEIWKGGLRVCVGE
ncbi:hypothetical protein N7492_003883 [Penicillium capsulatum]|uniref:RecA family profile 1 domain-containing protein n=1 Tax=Penicillium capsulatum TaxID=69766 RepID=A0A9W9IKA7_9EURO|nr:hypothetical protein N7492_003883 [Penicillium capsulatum]KAJ6121538.1 hypothetical protein N7512_004003 [Penicillium capsulatum]